MLGRVTGPRRESLREIWAGTQARALRDAVRVGDLRLGCDGCAGLIQIGRRADSLAATYDDLAPEVPGLQHPLHLDLAISNTCNLQCGMCNGDLSSAIRTQREGRPPLPPAYDDRFFAELRELLPHVRSAQFKGGEPFLARECRRIWDDMLDLGTRCDILTTTNGTQLNEAVERYVTELRMSLLVSIDGATAETNEAIRVGTDHERVLHNLARFVQLTDATGRDVGLSICLVPDNWHEIGDLLALADRLGASAYVIWVDQPQRFDLLALPPDELREVLRSVRAEDRTRRDSLVRTRDTWIAFVERLEREVAARTSDAGDGSAPTATAPAATEADLVAELAAWSGRDPLVVRCRGDLIEEVAAQPWAEPLAPASWLGSSRADLVARMWDATGSTAAYDVANRPDGTTIVDVRLEGGSWTGALRVLLHDRPEGQLVVMAPRPG